jgi:deoxyribodipyrimidine photolyase-like uncharacterized protein
MYWNFLARNRERLAGNQRMALPLRSLARRPAVRQQSDARTTATVRELLTRGERVTPAALGQSLFEDA